jgi:outer membrane protein assembly factor BamB
LHQLTLTLTDRAVLGILGQADRSFSAIGAPPQGEPRLVCLERQTGKENWVIDLGGIELPKDIAEDQQKAIRSLKMNGSPLVVGDSVLVSARGTKQAQFEDCWVLCFQLGSGKFRWATYVASSSTVGAQFGVQTQPIESTSHLGYANGRIFVMSNLGTLAALDAYSGTIVWLDIYERGVADANPFVFGGQNGMPMQGALNKPWVYNPVIVKDGNAFVLPSEGRYLYIYDANSGAEVKRLRRTDFGNANLLLAVIGDQVVVGGEKKIFCTNWKTYDIENADASLVWSSVEFPDGLRGRPFVTSDSVFVTDTNRLSRLSLKGGRVVDAYPKGWKPWDEKDEGPGNVLVTADHVVIAGASNVYCYTDLTLARGKLDKEIAAAPEDPTARLHYAEVVFTAGEHAAAIAKLDEAIKLLGGEKSMRVGASRDQLYNDALAFAQKLSSKNAGAGEDEIRPAELTKFANDLYDRAALAASSPQQQVHYRLSRAGFAEGVKDAVTAIKLYQEILSSAELRPVALLDENGGPTQASAEAEGKIRKLIERAGTAVYEPYEQAAAKELAAAQAAAPPKPDPLLNVAQTFPNSKIAPQALLAAADAYEAAGRAQAAVQVLRQMYFKYTDSPDRPRILESMARNYLTLPHRAEVAAARLAQGVALPGEHKLSHDLKLPEGNTITAGTTFADALEEVRKFSGQAAAKNLPDFRLPVPPRYPPAAERKKNPRWPFPAPGAELVIDGVSALAVPLRDFARADRVVARQASGEISIFKPGESKPISTSKTIFDVPRGSAWIGDNVLVWSNSTVMLQNERSETPAWRLDLKDLPNVDLVRPGGPVVAEGVQVRGPNGLINVRAIRRGEQPFVMQNGQLRPLPQLPPGARANPGGVEQIDEVRPVGDRALITTTTGRILSADLSNGRAAWQARLSDRQFDRVVANEDFTVLKTSDETSVRITVMDTYTGQIRGTRPFSIATGIVPLNIALAPDGTLVYTLPDKLVLKDLYKSWEASDRDIIGGGPGQSSAPPFINALGPDQLVIAEGRILALAEAGNGAPVAARKYVRVHSLETGQPVTLRVPQDGGMVDLQLVAGTDSWDVKLRVIGPRLYIINPQTILCYNLDKPEQFWEGVVDENDAASVPNVKDVFFGQKHVVLRSEQPPILGRAKPRQTLMAYGRYSGKPNDTAESGRIDYESPIVEDRSITQWQGVEGGFYYLTEDNKLHFLASAQ